VNTNDFFKIFLSHVHNIVAIYIQISFLHDKKNSTLMEIFITKIIFF
jgi:hypothetical protein